MKICPRCNCHHTKPGTFCSRICANSRGPRTEEFKQKVRTKLLGRKVPEEVKDKIRGNNHPKRRNKEFSEFLECKIIECMECGVNFRQKIATQKFCTQKCWQENSRKNRDAYTQYKFDCRFKFNVYDYPEWFDLDLITKYGWYSASNRGNNISGVSRDHKYSIREGFKHNVSPEIISHPMNCELMIQSLNSKKKTKCSISIEELISMIKNFDDLLAE